MDQLKTPVIGVDEKLQRNATELMETRASEVVMTDSPWNLTGYQGAQIGPTEANSNQTIGQLGKVKSPHTLEIHQTGRHIKDSAKAHSIPSEDALKIYKNYEKTEIPLVSRVTNTSSSGMLSLDTTWMPRTENMTKGSPTFERMVKRSLSSNRTKNDSTESAEGDFLSLITNTTERVGESLQTYDATGTTRADKTDADLQSLVTPRNPQSCAHRCTDDTNFPCSCDEKCVVYKTCCADFAQTCAGLFRRAVTKFRNLLFVSVRCDALTSVIVVESCPPTSPEEMHPSDIEGIDLEAILSTGVSYDKLSPSEDESLDTYSLSGILSNAPVTDYETGIIYANTSIYECNTGNTISGSSQSSDDIKGTWKTQIGTFSEEFENKVSNTQAKLDFSTYSFVPPTTHPAAAGSLCFSNWTLTCIAQMSSRLGLGLVTCNTSVNEYYRLRSVFPTLPLPDLHTSHLVCAICLADFQKLTGNGHRFFIHGFKTLMSISDVPGYVEYSFQENSVRFEKPIPWSKWRCSIPDKAITQNYGQCTTLQCNSLFLLLPNGECKKAAATEIAIQEDLLFKGKLCRLDPAAFANAAKCYLDGFHGLKMSSKPLRSYRDTRTSRPANFTTNRNLIIIKMEMYFKTAAFDTEIWNLQTGYFRFFAAMMIFAQNYCSKNETAQDISSKAVTASPPIDIESTDIATLWPIGTNVTATDVLSCFIFSYCFNIHDANVNLFNDLDCEITSEIRTPSSYIQVGEMFSEVLDLQCLGESYDVSDLVSKGCKVFSQHITMHCFALLLFLFGFNGALPCGYLSF
ncbi:hypothetical protein EGW08_019806 [Elysia chlorotica]|uniref:SMB domain-containing protein n=1 Tax=Elysia chlorotica TaxID=188477 RepID=A0A3S1B160_ELYCH|nr:hypothetical protein EGW08_019806 [Elysia chlorotica]